MNKKTTDGARGDKAKLGEAARGEGRIALSDEVTHHSKSEQDERAGLLREPSGSTDEIREDKLTGSSRQNEYVSDKGLDDFQQEELSGTSDDTLKAVNYSDTDEDEDEGLGDGNLGRSVREGLE
jgi:hypothetical protein